MIVLYLLALAWVAFAFFVCIGDFFTAHFNSIACSEETVIQPQKAQTMKAAA